jgi:hypothetical protein
MTPLIAPNRVGAILLTVFGMPGMPVVAQFESQNIATLMIIVVSAQTGDCHSEAKEIHSHP